MDNMPSVTRSLPDCRDSLDYSASKWEPSVLQAHNTTIPTTPQEDQGFAFFFQDSPLCSPNLSLAQENKPLTPPPYILP